MGFNKLLQNILAEKRGEVRAREIFAVIVGAYDTRFGGAQPMSSKISGSLKFAGIDAAASHLRQGEQLIGNFGHTVWCIRSRRLQEVPGTSCSGGRFVWRRMSAMGRDRGFAQHGSGRRRSLIAT